jgi:hypothetical protein
MQASAFAQPVRSAPIHRGRAAESRERPHECGHYEHRQLKGSGIEWHLDIRKLL